MYDDCMCVNRWCMLGHLDCVHSAHVSAFSGSQLPCSSMHMCIRDSVEQWHILHSSMSCSSASLSGVQLPEFSSLTISGRGLNFVHVLGHSVSSCLISWLPLLCFVILFRMSTRLWWSPTMQHSWALHCQWWIVKSLLSWMTLLPAARSVIQHVDCKICSHICLHLMVLSYSTSPPDYKLNSFESWRQLDITRNNSDFSVECKYLWFSWISLSQLTFRNLYSSTCSSNVIVISTG